LFSEFSLIDPIDAFFLGATSTKRECSQTLFCELLHTYEILITIVAIVYTIYDKGWERRKGQTDKDR
jgi:hypothetical protein